MAKAEATNIFDTKATLTLNATDDRNGILTYKVTIGEIATPQQAQQAKTLPSTSQALLPRPNTTFR